jgi:hypothetical protein
VSNDKKNLEKAAQVGLKWEDLLVPDEYVYFEIDR